MSGRLVLATRNDAKLHELRRIVATANVEVELLGLVDVPDVPEVKETGATFAENALLKAHAVTSSTGLPAVADDSGLCVDALNGMPGIFSARWSGRHGDDEANLRLLLAQTVDVPDERRGAVFVCAAALVVPSGAQHMTEGRLTGSILRAPRGNGGFGYDPIFRPDGETRTTAQMSAGDKDAISHRGRAFRALAEDLRALLR